MTDAAKLRTRAATPADASAIAAIYNEGIADRIATFETDPRSAYRHCRVVHWRASRGGRRNQGNQPSRFRDVVSLQ
jgi:L-amino acid N-acyltransferase YncA